MRIAIHQSKGSFSDQWIEFCEKNNIDFKIVNALDSDIMAQLQDCDIFMWHHHHGNYRDVLASKPVLFALEQGGVKVFPNFNTGWHFDDKVAQKYLFEFFDFPLVPSYVFYEKDAALQWAESTIYPKVFKLKGGAGSSNVKLVSSKYDCKKLIRKAFKTGFSQFSKGHYFNEQLIKFRETRNVLFILKAFARLFILPEFAKMGKEEKGYVYFQDFIPGNHTDFRLKIVDNKCWGFQRQVRKNDFRASGSGHLIYDNDLIPQSMIKLAFEISEKLNLQSAAFDFIVQESKPLLVEMSYGFGIDAEEFNYGYWTKDLIWHDEKFVPQYWMIENILRNEI